MTKAEYLHLEMDRTSDEMYGKEIPELTTQELVYVLNELMDRGLSFDY